MSEYSRGENSPVGLDVHGLTNLKNVFWNLPTPALYEEALKRDEAIMAHLGPLIVRTGQFTGRSPKDKFIVDEPSSHDHIWWGRSIVLSTLKTLMSYTVAWRLTCNQKMFLSKIAGVALILTTGCQCA